MPFIDLSKPAGGPGGAAGALARDVITRLAKLRSLFVIAQGTMFALHEQGITAQAAARMLNVDYVASGSVYRGSNRLAVMVELTETRTSRIVWSETFDHRIDDALLVLEEIGDRIVASIASEIEANERNHAILKQPSSLDAWEAHHRGLWHMYRFNKPDNDQARHFFEMAVRLDPTFARAYAGLSFTHFQSAFQGWEKRESQIDRAFESAGNSLMADDRDPAAHWAMGRALFLRGRHDQSIVELEHAIDLSPNFALAHYMFGLVHSQTGDPAAAIASSDRARQLSPFDPMLFAPLGARAMALVRMRQLRGSRRVGHESRCPSQRARAYTCDRGIRPGARRTPRAGARSFRRYPPDGAEVLLRRLYRRDAMRPRWREAVPGSRQPYRPALSDSTLIPPVPGLPNRDGCSTTTATAPRQCIALRPQGTPAGSS